MMNRYIKIAVVCIIAALLNIFASAFFRNFLNLTLFIDTVFTAAMTFAFGLIPGLVTAILSWLLPCIYWKDINLFVLCSIIEVLIIFALKPKSANLPPYASRERVIASYIGIAAKLMLLYFICMVTVSITGGIIDFISPYIIYTHHQYFHVENTFKLVFMLNSFPVLAVNILSRIPINIVDRFIVVFGGYFVSLGLLKKR